MTGLLRALGTALGGAVLLALVCVAGVMLVGLPVALVIRGAMLAVQWLASLG